MDEAAEKAAAKARAQGRSISRQQRAALPAQEAYEFLAGQDRRPLLVLRECLTCTGTDDALLTKNADNEKTMLMSRWFHCVKLPPDVIEADHPFHALFPGKDPGHLFVARWDGTNRLDLNGAQSRTELWKVMARVLALDYVEKPDRALKRIAGILGELDGLDGKIGTLEKRLERALEKYGPESKKLKKLEKELARLTQQRDEVRQEADEVSRLSLKEPAPQQVGAGAPTQESA